MWKKYRREKKRILSKTRRPMIDVNDYDGRRTIEIIFKVKLYRNNWLSGTRTMTRKGLIFSGLSTVSFNFALSFLRSNQLSDKLLAPNRASIASVWNNYHWDTPCVSVLGWSTAPKWNGIWLSWYKRPWIENQSRGICDVRCRERMSREWFILRVLKITEIAVLVKRNHCSV